MPMSRRLWPCTRSRARTTSPPPSAVCSPRSALPPPPASPPAATSAAGAPAFLYQFTRVPFDNPLGAFHGVEIPYVFGNAEPFELLGQIEQADLDLSAAIMGYWTTLRRHRRPQRRRRRSLASLRPGHRPAPGAGRHHRRRLRALPRSLRSRRQGARPGIAIMPRVFAAPGFRLRPAGTQRPQPAAFSLRRK